MKIKDQGKNLRFLFEPWWKNGKPLIAGLLVSAVVLSPAAGFFSATLAQAVIERVQQTHSFKSACLTGLLYLALALGLALMKSLFEDFYCHWKKQELEGIIERSVYEKALSVDYSHFDNPDFFDSYKLATEKFSTQSSETLQHVFSLLSEIARFLVYGGLIASHSIILLLIVIASSAFAAYAQIYWSKVSVDRETAMVNERRKADYLQRLFYHQTAVADMRVSKIKEPLFSMYDSSVKNRVGVFKRYSRKEFVIDALVSVAQLGTTFAVPVYVAWGGLSGQISSIGVYATLIASSMALKETLNALGWWSSQIALGVAYAEKVKLFFNVDSTVERSPGTIIPNDDPFSLVLDNVSYRYPNSDFAIRNVNLSIKPGQKIAVVGENGVGKTTLTKLLLRLYDVDSGEIRINGHRIDEYDLTALRNKIGITFQNSILYALSVRKNMTAYSDCGDEQLAETLQTVGLQLDLDSQVTREFDEDGVVLSGGDAQRLCLSRLLHSKFGLLILDEPSSALDPIAEYNLAKLIFNESPTTTIMIAHRLSTVVDADLIVLLAEGRVAEMGTHRQLMEKQGKYAQMFAKQAEGYQRF